VFRARGALLSAPGSCCCTTSSQALLEAPFLQNTIRVHANSAHHGVFGKRSTPPLLQTRLVSHRTDIAVQQQMETLGHPPVPADVPQLHHASILLRLSGLRRYPRRPPSPRLGHGRLLVSVCYYLGLPCMYLWPGAVLPRVASAVRRRRDPSAIERRRFSVRAGSPCRCSISAPPLPF